MDNFQKIAVIGSNSFSGSDLIDLLLSEDHYEVIGLSRSPEKKRLFLPYKKRDHAKFKFYQVDLNSDTDRIISIFDDFKPQCIVNFAAQSEVGPSWDYP